MIQVESFNDLDNVDSTSLFIRHSFRYPIVCDSLQPLVTSKPSGARLVFHWSFTEIPLKFARSLQFIGFLLLPTATISNRFIFVPRFFFINKFIKLFIALFECYQFFGVPDSSNCALPSLLGLSRFISRLQRPTRIEIQ